MLVAKYLDFEGFPLFFFCGVEVGILAVVLGQKLVGYVLKVQIFFFFFLSVLVVVLVCAKIGDISMLL